MVDSFGEFSEVNKTPKTMDEIIRFLKLCMGPQVDRVFATGLMLIEVDTGKRYKEMGFATFQEFFNKLGFKRATVYSNMAIAKTFNFRTHGHLGCGKLRLLAMRKVTNPIELIEQGIPELDHEGNIKLLNVKEMNYRQFEDALDRYLSANPAAAQSELSRELEVAAEALASDVDNGDK